MKKIVVTCLIVLFIGCKKNKEWYCVKLTNNYFPKIYNETNIIINFEEFNLSIPSNLLFDSIKSTNGVLKYANKSSILLMSKNSNDFSTLKVNTSKDKLSDRVFYELIYKDSSYKFCNVKSIISPSMGKNFIKKYKSALIDVYQYGSFKHSEFVVVNAFSNKNSYTFSLKGLNDEQLKVFISSLKNVKKRIMLSTPAGAIMSE